MLERTDAITNEILEPITSVLSYPTVYNEDSKTNTNKNSQTRNTVRSREREKKMKMKIDKRNEDTK